MATHTAPLRRAAPPRRHPQAQRPRMPPPTHTMLCQERYDATPINNQHTPGRAVSVQDIRLQLPWSTTGFCRLTVSNISVTLHVPGGVTVLPAPRHGRPLRARVLHAVDALLWGRQQHGL